MPIVIHAVWISIYATFIAVYIGEDLQHMGIVMTYGLGRILVIMAGESFIPKVHPPRDAEYAMATGPASCGFILMGFFLNTAGYALIKRHTGAWLGMLMPPLFGCYEFLATWAIGVVTASKLVEKAEVLEAYRGSQQGLHPSCVISTAHALAESARLALVMSNAANEEDSNHWLVAIPAGFIWNVLARTFCIHYLFNMAFLGKLPVSSPSILLQDVKYTMGYPRFFGVLSIILARMFLGNPVVPNGQEALVQVVAAMLTAECLEDMVVCVCTKMGWLAPAVLVNVDDMDESEIIRMAEHRLDKIKKTTGGKSKATQEDTIMSTSAESGDFDHTEHELAVAVQVEKDRLWFFTPACFAVQPYWCHFSSAMLSQLHMMLFLIAFTNGLDYILGSCSEDKYAASGRGVVWWPLPDASNPCQ